MDNFFPLEGGPPPVYGFIGFIEGPLIETVGEFAGRVIPIAEDGVEGIGKALPWPWLQKLFKRTKKGTQQQQKEDGKRVITVHEAIAIVEDHLNGIVATAEEFADVVRKAAALPVPTGENTSTLLTRIADEMRKKALQQSKPKNNFFPDQKKKGKNKGKVVDRTRRKVGDHKKKTNYLDDADYPAPVHVIEPTAGR